MEKLFINKLDLLDSNKEYINNFLDKDCLSGLAIEVLNSIMFISLGNKLGQDNKEILLFEIDTSKISIVKTEGVIPDYRQDY